MATTAPDGVRIAKHSEVLCFVVNKARSVPFEVLVKICSKLYSGDKIHVAKELLWETAISPSFPGRSELRLIKCKNGVNTKEQSDMEDILKSLQACDRGGVKLPQLYTLDLVNIPPVSPNQADIGALRHSNVHIPICLLRL